MELTNDILQLNTDSALIGKLLSLVEHAKNLELANKKLAIELATLRRMRFAAKTEAMNAEQRQLFEEGWQADVAEIEAALTPARVADEQTRAEPVRRHAARQPLPAHLPRVEFRHEPTCCDCAECGARLTLLRDEITEMLDVEPAKFFVQRHIRPQYSCRICEKIVAAPAPAAVIDGGLAAPGLLSWLIVQKFHDHLPLYRLEQIAARSGVNLASSTLSDWLGRCGAALAPLAQRLGQLLRERSVLHADETPVRQLDPGNGKTKRAYLWAWRSNTLDDGPPLLVFDYQTSRAGAHARAFLGDWRGDLVVDDYSGYKALFASGVREVGCWAHARRKFFELHAATKSARAAEALRYIGALYAMEAQARELSNAHRAELRQRSQTLLREFKRWLDDTRQQCADGGALAKAIDYSVRRWPSLSRYADGGHLPIDNNPVENSIRPLAIGKKIGYLPAQSAPANAPPRCNPCSAPPN